MTHQDAMVESVSEPGKKRAPIGRILVIFLAVVLCVLTIWVIVNLHDIRAFQAMPSGAYAKFMCSSLFVVGMDEESAKEWSSVSIPMQELNVDYETKTVSARALFYTNVAQYQGERYGCTLE
jgi:CHASE2 domain-containing sensor protein